MSQTDRLHKMTPTTASQRSKRFSGPNSSSSPNIYTNNSHFLREDERIAHRESRVMRKMRDPRMGKAQHSPIAHIDSSPSQGESYYTVYRDPTLNVNRDHHAKYFDERGKAIDPVDLLFEDPDDKQHSHNGSKIFKKFGKSKNQLPCIGAKELAYKTRQNTRDMQLNAMPSFTQSDSDSYSFNVGQDSAAVDSAFETMKYDTNTGTYRRTELIHESNFSNSNSTVSSTIPSRATSRVLSRVPSTVPSRVLSFTSLNEKALPDSPDVPPVEESALLAPFSIWDCISYVASFIPAVPLPEAPITQNMETTQEKESETAKPVTLDPPFEYKKELPPVPKEKHISRVRKVREKIHEFSNPESPNALRQESRKFTINHGDDQYNRGCHPNFTQSDGNYRKEKFMSTSKLGY